MKDDTTIPSVKRNRSNKDLMVSTRKYFKDSKKVMDTYKDSLIIPRTNAIFNISEKGIDNPMAIAVYVISCTFKRDNVSKNSDFKTYPVNEDMIFSRFRFKSKLTEKRKKVKKALDDLAEIGAIKREYLDNEDKDKRSSLFTITYVADATKDGQKMYMTMTNDSLDRLINIGSDMEKIASIAVATGIMSRMNVINESGYDSAVNKAVAWSEVLSLNNIVSYESMSALGARTGFDRSTISIYIKKLIESQVIAVIKVKKNVSRHGGWSNIYSKYEERWLLKRYVECLSDTVMPSQHAMLNIVDVWDDDLVKKDTVINEPDRFEEDDDDYVYEEINDNSLDGIITLKIKRGIT